jgi:hypothetical protein
VLLMVLLVGAAFVMLRPLENSELPFWDGGRITRPGARSAAVGTLLCVAAAATLASVGWGLKDQGLVCVAVMLVTLGAARWLAEDDVAPRPASAPASRTV